MKLLVVLLVAANLGLWAWSQGWLAPTLPAPQAAEREPQRLATQQSPQLVTVVPPQAASAAMAAAAATPPAAPVASAADAASVPPAGAGLANPTGQAVNPSQPNRPKP